jgi:hypothetical protein
VSLLCIDHSWQPVYQHFGLLWRTGLPQHAQQSGHDV